MTILGLQRRIREVGRIRIGVQAATRTGKRAPKKLDKFRLTSPDRAVIEAAAALLGGTANQWDNNGVTQWEVVTDADELRILLPPNPTDMAFTQYYELWGKGFCARRCDGEREQIQDRACQCDPEARECKPTTRLSVLLPDIAGLGLWRLESHGYYAAVELAGAVELIEAMAGAHTMIPARLRLDRREVRRLVNNKPVVHKFAVPVIDLDVSVLGVRALAARVTDEPVPEIEPGADTWQPVPEPEPPPALSVESQVREHEEAKPRGKKVPALMPTHRQRNTVDVEQRCDVCGKAYGAEALIKNPNPDGSRFIHRTCKGAPAVTEASPEGDDPPSEMVDDGGSGPPGDEASVAEPTPAVARPQGDWPMTAGQHRKIMATVAELFPVEPGTPHDEVDGYRKEITLELCAIVGAPQLQSRTDIDRDTANKLLDLLAKLESGEYLWDAEDLRVVDTVTGAVLGAGDG